MTTYPVSIFKHQLMSEYFRCPKCRKLVHLRYQSEAFDTPEDYQYFFETKETRKGLCKGDGFIHFVTQEKYKGKNILSHRLWVQGPRKS